MPLQKRGDELLRLGASGAHAYAEANKTLGAAEALVLEEGVLAAAGQSAAGASNVQRLRECNPVRRFRWLEYWSVHNASAFVHGPTESSRRATSTVHEWNRPDADYASEPGDWRTVHPLDSKQQWSKAPPRLRVPSRFE